MKTLNLLFAIVIAGALMASGVIERRARAKIRDNAELQQQQEQQRVALEIENRRLAGLHAQAGTNRLSVDDESSELAQLRARAAELRQQTNQLAQLARQMAAERRLAGTRFYIVGDSNLLTHNHELSGTIGGGPRATGKLNDARVLTAGMRRFATDHQGAFPASLDQVTTYLPAH